MQKKKFPIFFKAMVALLCNAASAQSIPPSPVIPTTGISGLYEVMVGTADAQYQLKYFAEFGFRVVDSGSISKEQALLLYGVPSSLKSYRLQNGEIDSHGLLRLLQWENPLGNGVGYGEPETVGSRMSVMKTNDIMRLNDLFKMLRETKQEKWLPTEPYFDDPLKINANSNLDFFKRPVGVRENAVYGDWFTHVFFQRYGYTIPGYGTVNPSAPLKTSEFTHHDFFIKVDSMEQLQYLQTAFGLKREKAPEIDGDWLKGPREVFMMPKGYSHWYVGYVSPNNICGKLKFFMTRGSKPDQSAHQRPGELGITLHSFYTDKLQFVLDLVRKQQLKTTAIIQNEFGEKSFVCRGTEGTTWQIIEKMQTKNKPVTTLEIVRTND